MSTRAGSVVLADADARARRITAASLSRAGYETIEVASGAEALDAAREEGVRLVVLEVEFPDMTGYEVCHELRKQGELPIVFVSAIRTEPLDRVAGLLLGADDFIVKPFDPIELMARVRRVVAGRPISTAPTGGAEGPRLTGREREVLALLAGGHGQNDIAQRLSISPKTVATHIQRLLGKLDVHSRAELVARAYVLGLVGRSAAGVGR